VRFRAASNVAGMMGNLFKPGNSRPMERPDTTEIDEMLNEDPFRERCERTGLFDVTKTRAKVVMDIPERRTASVFRTPLCHGDLRRVFERLTPDHSVHELESAYRIQYCPSDVVSC
jgi:hypothetical protein